MNIIPQIAEAMQIVLTTTADITGCLSGFVKRERKLTGSGFVQTVVFGWLGKPSASLEELTQTAASLGIEISPQGLDKRFTLEASECLKQTLEAAVGTLISDNPVAIPILQRFNGVYIQDSSVVVLPDELKDVFQGCGGSSEINTQASVKLQVRLDMNTGGIDGPYLQAGRVSDRSSYLQEKSLPKASLRIADLGYFSLENLSYLNTQSVYWLSKIFSQCILYDKNELEWDLVEFLSAYCDDKLDMPILLGAKERMPCRLIAVSVPEDVAKERRRKIRANAIRRGKTPSKRQLDLANWTIVVTSVPKEILTLDEAFVLLRIRWQIELLFKLWKSHGKIDDWRSEKPFRILCEFYAKLLAMRTPTPKAYGSSNTGYYFQAVGDFQIVVLLKLQRQFKNTRSIWQLLSLLGAENVCMKHWRLLDVVWLLGVGLTSEKLNQIPINSFWSFEYNP